MTYKIKSLIYLICFAASSILYYNMDHEFKPLSNAHTTEVTKVDVNKTHIDNKVEAVEIQ